MNASGGVSSDDDNLDQDESSSSSNVVEDILASFREKWQRELVITSQKNLTNQASITSWNETSIDELPIENKAKHLFLKGVEHEQNGELYDAIRFYKRAVQLVPDIESKLYESTKPKVRENNDISQELDVDEGDEKKNIDDEDTEESDLFIKFSKIVNKNQCLCYPRVEQSAMHVSALPLEIVIYILRWVVSSDLDLRSLEMISSVCRGLYVAARDPEIWRLACVKIWGINCGTFQPKYQSWRHMYLERPHLFYNGCYVSKTTYIRHGENSFQDQFYRPWHIVQYFRYLRFFPEGRVLMVISAEDAQSCVNALKNRIPKNTMVYVGHYRLYDGIVALVMKKQDLKQNINVSKKKRRDEVVHDSGEQTYHMELNIQSHQKKSNLQLSWLRYHVFTKYKNGQETKTVLNLSGRYNPFKFSRVRSYTQESEYPLQ